MDDDKPGWLMALTGVLSSVPSIIVAAKTPTNQIASGGVGVNNQGLTYYPTTPASSGISTGLLLLAAGVLVVVLVLMRK
jgi:uncharacterized membrane protein HdeD (DUF308 family)